MARKKGGQQQQGALTKQEERTVKRDIQKVKAKVEGMKKKDAWRKEVQRFQDQMLTVGFTMKEMAGDGNCLFRAIGDQLESAPDKHEHYRHRVVDYLRENRENFEPFIIDMPFDDYCKRMATSGTWGGNIELQAASLALNINITVHQLDQPRWQIANFGEDHRMIHISYHDGQHYNSLYPVDKSKAKQASTIGSKSSSSSSCSSSSSKHNDLIKLTMDSTGFTDRKLVEEILQDCEWELDAAIESLIAMQGTLEYDEPEVRSVPTNSAPKVLVETQVSHSAPTPSTEISIYDEDAAIQASLIEYELQQNTSTHERKVEIPGPSEFELMLQQSVLASLALSEQSVKTKSEEKESEDSSAKKTTPPFAKPKQTNNKKVKPPAARKLTNRERKAQKKESADENRQQKREDMNALLERLTLEEQQKQAANAEPVVDLGVRLI